MNTLHYGCTALHGTNKVGMLKPDEDGRYDIILGALEYPNSVGDIYTLESAQRFFREGSPLLRKINNGQLRAEYGHPMPEPGMSRAQYLSRLMMIKEDKVCAHISDVYIDFHSVKDRNTGRSIITFRGKVKPTGPYGQYLKEMLDDPKQNVAFSVRSITQNQPMGFRQHRHFTDIITWDYVNEPGLAPANKYQSPSLESHQDALSFVEEDSFEITRSLIDEIKNSEDAKVSLECANVVKRLESYFEESSSNKRLSW